MSRPRRSLSSLAASILLPTMLGTSGGQPASGGGGDAEERSGEVRRNSDATRLTDETPTHPHRPSGHGA
jgi:hypothetical protein